MRTDPLALEVAASCITPFAPSGEIDPEVLRQQLRRFVEAGLTRVWLASSGSAEGNVLTVDEMEHIARIAVAEVGGQIEVAAMGPEPRSARASIEFAQRMFDLGVDAVQVGPLDPGHSYLPTPAELARYYEDAVSALRGSCYLATHISVGYEAPPQLLIDTARKHERIRGVNVTHMRNYMYSPQVIDLASNDVPVHLGSPIGGLEALVLGATGILSSFDVNVAPRLYRQLIDAWATQDLRAVADAFVAINKLFRAILSAGGLIVAKAVLEALGLPVGPPRPPRRGPDDAIRQHAARIVDEFDLRL